MTMIIIYYYDYCFFVQDVYNSYKDFKDDINPVLSSPGQWYIDYR